MVSAEVALKALEAEFPMLDWACSLHTDPFRDKAVFRGIMRDGSRRRLFIEALPECTVDMVLEKAREGIGEPSR